MLKIIILLIMIGISKQDIEIKARGYESTYFLTKYILGYNKLTVKCHKSLCDFIDKTDTDILDLEPRDHFKTTCISVGYVMRMILNNPDIKILLNHKIMKKSKEILGEVKSNFETNRMFRYYYGDWVGKVWANDQIVVKHRRLISKEPTISVGGTDHEATSGHYNLIINDDLAGLKDMYSEAERINTLRYYRSLRYLRDSGNWMKEITIGTRWALEDVYNHIITKRAKITKRIKTAYDDNGQPYFPERFSLELLAEMQGEDAIGFSAQMMNNPMPVETQIFRYDDLKFFDQVPVGDLNYMYIDLALKKTAASDYTAMIIGTKSEGKKYIMDAWIGRGSPDEIEGIIVAKCREHRLRQIGIESNSFQEIYVNNIKKRMEAERLEVEITPVVHSSDKILRINSIHGDVVKNVMFRRDWEDAYPILINQLLAFPQGKHDDAPDALEGLLSMFERYGDPRITML